MSSSSNGSFSSLNAKKTFQYFYNLLETTSITLILPFIIFRVVKTIYFKRKQMALAGKVVVITGASSGLGEAISHEFYKHGCQVVLCARRRQELERVRSDLLQMYATIPTHPPVVMPLNLNEINSLEDVIDKILAITNRIDILVNNGGISHRGSIKDTAIDVDIKIMTVNYFGAVALTKAVLPHMIKRKEGHIIAISSVQGLIALPNRSAYSASKHALQAFNDSLRAEVADYNIHVTVISPGYIRTSLSVNALTASGDAHGKMDETTAGGYSPDYVAEHIVKAIIQKKKEVIVAPLLPRLAVILRKFFPWLYFLIMSYSAKEKVAV